MRDVTIDSPLSTSYPQKHTTKEITKMTAKVKEEAKSETALMTQSDSQMMQELLLENLGGGTLTASDLTKIDVPKGGTFWEVPTGEGEEIAPFMALDGVVIAQMPHRIMYAERAANDTEIKPPLCVSSDAITGYGTPGGSCAKCPMAQYGTKGRGQACSARMFVYFLRDGDFLPVVIDLSPASLPNLRRYMTQLTTTARKPFYAVRTRMTLKKMEVPGGMGSYSIVEFKLIDQLDTDQVAVMKATKVMFLQMLQTTPIEPPQQADWFETADKAPKGQIVDDVPTF
jgi:hypothetical protein